MTDADVFLCTFVRDPVTRPATVGHNLDVFLDYAADYEAFGY